MGGINSKQKGNRGERELAKLLRSHGFQDAKRGQQYTGSPDSPDVVGIPGFHIESKFLASGLNTYKSLEQAKEDAGENIPLVFHRRISKSETNLPWLVVLEAEDFLRIIS